jgi:hypothetical protein
METKPDKPTYADRWRDAINETYTDPREYAAQFLVRDELQDGEDELAAIRRVLTKAAECLPERGSGYLHRGRIGPG